MLLWMVPIAVLGTGVNLLQDHARRYQKPFMWPCQSRRILGRSHRSPREERSLGRSPDELTRGNDRGKSPSMINVRGFETEVRPRIVCLPSLLQILIEAYSVSR